MWHIGPNCCNPLSPTFSLEDYVQR